MKIQESFHDSASDPLDEARIHVAMPGEFPIIWLFAIFLHTILVSNSSFSDFFIKNNFMLIHITLEATCVMRNVIASLISKDLSLRDVFKRNVLRSSSNHKNQI